MGEGNPRGAIAAFHSKNPRYDEIKIYKQGSSYYGDTGDFDFTAKNMKDLKDKLKRLGANPNDPSSGRLSETIEDELGEKYNLYHSTFWCWCDMITQMKLGVTVDKDSKVATLRVTQTSIDSKVKVVIYRENL